MHELSLCQSIYTIADRAREGRSVDAVHLRIGRLRQVVPETLAYCWAALTEATDLSGSWLDIEQVPVELLCRECAARTVVEDALVVACRVCGGGRVEIVSGEEFVLTSLDVGDTPQLTELKESHG